MLKAFIDDSGSDALSTWYVLAGYLGTVEDWDSFDAQWDDVLNAPPRVALREPPHSGYFHSADAERLSRYGLWAGISRDQRNAKIDALIDVIGRCTRRAICARMRRSDYNELVKGKIPEMWDSPYYFLYTTVIGAAINIERIDGHGDDIEFIFDLDEQHEEKSKAMIPALLNMKCTWGSLANVSRKNDKEFKPLQAADLLAWQIRRFFCVDERRRRHFDAARNAPPEPYHEFVITRKTTREMITGIQEQAARVAASLGRSPEVRTWS